MAQRLTRKGKSLVNSPKRTRAPQTEHDWPAIKRDYVEGIPVPGSDDPLELQWLSVEQVGNRHSVPASTMYARSAQEHWPALRQSYIIQIERKRRRARLRILAQEGIKHDKNVLAIAKMGQSVVIRRLGEMVRMGDMRKQIGDLMEAQIKAGHLPDLDALDGLADFDAKELESLSSAATRFEELGRRVLGDVNMDELDAADAQDESDSLSLSGQMAQSNVERTAELIVAMQNLNILDPASALMAEDGMVDEDGNLIDPDDQDDDPDDGPRQLEAGGNGAVVDADEPEGSPGHMDVEAAIDAAENAVEADLVMVAGAVLAEDQQRWDSRTGAEPGTKEPSTRRPAARRRAKAVPQEPIAWDGS